MRRLAILVGVILLALAMMSGPLLAKPVEIGSDNPQCLGHRTATHASGQNPGVNPQGNPAQRAENDNRFDSVKDVMNHVKGNC